MGIDYRAATAKPVYVNEVKLEDPERVWVRLRAGLQARRYRRIVETLPPVRTRAEIRKGRQLTQEAVAHRLRITQARLSRMERCANPPVRLLNRLIEALGAKLYLVVRFAESDFTIKL